MCVFLLSSCLCSLLNCKVTAKLIKDNNENKISSIADVTNQLTGDE